MIRNGRAVQGKLSSTAVLSFVIILALSGSGCGDFFVSGNALNSISVTPSSIFLTIGETKQFTANGTSVNGDSEDVTSTAKWSSSASSFATVSAGLVTAVATGTSTITASQDGVEANGGVIVNASALTGITVTGSTSTISSGSTVQLKATANFQDGSSKDITNQVTWASDSTNVATVSSTGLVTGVTIGTSNITASVTTTASTITSDKFAVNVQ